MSIQKSLVRVSLAQSAILHTPELYTPGATNMRRSRSKIDQKHENHRVQNGPSPLALTIAGQLYNPLSARDFGHILRQAFLAKAAGWDKNHRGLSTLELLPQITTDHKSKHIPWDDAKRMFFWACTKSSDHTRGWICVCLTHCAVCCWWTHYCTSSPSARDSCFRVLDCCS